MSAEKNSFCVISGSQNKDSQSAKIGRVIADRLSGSGTSSVELIDLAATPLPLLGSEPNESEQAARDEADAAAAQADAFVFITPEWHGMVPAALKNYFLHFSRGELAHKPALIVAVSASAGGAYPVSELRASSYKNSRVCFLPEHLIIRQVNTVFNDSGENDPEAQAYLSARLDFCLEMLSVYATGMNEIRRKLPDTSPYPNGM